MGQRYNIFKDTTKKEKEEKVITMVGQSVWYVGKGLKKHGDFICLYTGKVIEDNGDMCRCSMKSNYIHHSPEYFQVNIPKVKLTISKH